MIKPIEMYVPNCPNKNGGEVSLIDCQYCKYYLTWGDNAISCNHPKRYEFEMTDDEKNLNTPLKQKR